MSTASSSFVHGEQGLRCTLECGGVASLVDRVEERRSLARPPELWVDVTVTPGHVPALAREPAALLMEGASGSRYVQGWVRGVERYADARLGARMRIHLVPTTLAGDAGAQAGVEAVEPEYVYDPASWASAEAGEREEDTQRFSRKDLPALRQEAQVRPLEESSVREQTVMLDVDEPRVTGTGTELLRREDILRMLGEGTATVVPAAAAARPSMQPEVVPMSGGTEHVTREHIAAIRRAAVSEGALGAPTDERTSQTPAGDGASTSRPSMKTPQSSEQEGTQPWSASDLDALRRQWEERRKPS